MSDAEDVNAASSADPFYALREAHRAACEAQNDAVLRRDAAEAAYADARAELDEATEAYLEAWSDARSAFDAWYFVAFPTRHPNVIVATNAGDL